MKWPPNEVKGGTLFISGGLARIGDITIEGITVRTMGLLLKPRRDGKTSQRPEFRRVARIPKILTPSIAANFCGVDSKVRRRNRRHFQAGRDGSKSWGKANCLGEIA